jgi:hypothetical protein
MRLVVALVALVACGGYRTFPPAHVAAPGCTVEGTLVDVGVADTDAPVVVAYVHHSFMPSEVVALWADGTIVMTRDRRLVQGAVAMSDAARVAQEVVAGIARSPDYAELPGPVDMPRVELFARAGTQWRHSFVWGASPHSYGKAPDGFVAAYRALLALHPTTTVPFQPAELALDYAPADLGTPAVPWPADLPEPPADQTTATLAGHYDAQLQALLDASSRQRPPRPIAFAERTWRVTVARRFRGEQVVDALRACVHRD